MSLVEDVDSRAFQKTLLKWWEGRSYDFPWRQSRDPYSVLVAELMLRKTSARQVLRVYPEFISQYPTLKELKNAEVPQLVRLLKPLGIEHERARLLKQLAEILAEGYGWKVPSNRDDLVKLPGVGRYTANAVLCFAFGKDLPALDANFIRVIRRVFGVESKKSRPRCDEKLWEFAERLVPKGRGRDFNFAVLDFARDICSARKPKCEACPVSSICRYFNAKMQVKKEIYGATQK